MSFEEAKELFYSNEEIRNQFDYWEIDSAIATINIFINDVEEIMKEKK